MSITAADIQFSNATQDYPKSSVGVFQLPCGIIATDGSVVTEVELREITGAEEDMLASKQVPDSQKMTLLTSRCITRIGTITDPTTIASLAKRLLPGDIVFLLFAVRRVSLGDSLPIKSKCPSCAHEALYTFDLKDLEVKPMKEQSKRAGYDLTVPSGRKVRLCCPSQADIERAQKVKGFENDQPSQLLLARIEQVDGEPASLESVKRLGLRDRQFIRESFESIDGGVETSIDMTCIRCEHEWKEDLEVGQGGFFFPSRVQKN